VYAGDHLRLGIWFKEGGLWSAYNPKALYYKGFDMLLDSMGLEYGGGVNRIVCIIS
jgi:hypothetical protein